MKFIRLEISMVVTAIMIAVTNILPAQNYSITPDDTIIGWVPYNDIYHFNFLQNNLTYFQCTCPLRMHMKANRSGLMTIRYNQLLEFRYTTRLLP